MTSERDHLAPILGWLALIYANMTTGIVHWLAALAAFLYFLISVSDHRELVWRKKTP